MQYIVGSGIFSLVQQSEDYVLRILEEGGVVTRRQIDSARSRLNGAASVIDVLINDGIVSDADVSRTLAAQAHMDWRWATHSTSIRSTV